MKQQHLNRQVLVKIRQELSSAAYHAIALLNKKDRDFIIGRILEIQSYIKRKTAAIKKP